MFPEIVTRNFTQDQDEEFCRVFISFVKPLVYDTLVLDLSASYVPIALLCNDCVMCLYVSSGCGGTFERLLLLFNLQYFLFSP